MAYKRDPELRKRRVKQYTLTFSIGPDAEVIEKLDKIDNKMGYIKRLIRADMGLEPERETAHFWDKDPKPFQPVHESGEETKTCFLHQRIRETDKEKLKAVSDTLGETMSDTITRLIAAEYDRVYLENTKIFSVTDMDNMPE